MKLKCYCDQILAGNKIMSFDFIIYDIKPTDILVDCLRRTGKMSCEIYFGHYYAHCNPACSCVDTLPYIIRDDKFVWDGSIRTVTVQEFFSTHGLTEDDVLKIETFDAGGAGWEDVIQLWNAVWPILEKAGALLSIAINIGTIIRRFIKSVGNEDGLVDTKDNDLSEVTRPDTVFCAILSRDSWSAVDLAEKLGVDRDTAKCFLKASGYNWDPRWQSYTITSEQREEMYKKLDDLNSKI